MKIKYLTYGYLALLLLGTLVPLTPISTALNDNYTLNIRWDYLLHAAAYLPLPVLMWLYLEKGSFKSIQSIGSSGSFLLCVVLFPLIIVSLFEAMQLIIPYRRFNINDMLAGSIGVIIGLLLLPVLKKLILRLNWF